MPRVEERSRTSRKGGKELSKEKVAFKRVVYLGNCRRNAGSEDPTVSGLLTTAAGIAAPRWSRRPL